MLDYAIRYDQNMDFYISQPVPEPARPRLDDFNVFKKSSPICYSNYYGNPTHDSFYEPEIDQTASVYHTLVNTRDFPREEWRNKPLDLWTPDDTVSWIIETIQCNGYSELDVAYHNFRISGMDLRRLRREDVLQKISRQYGDPNTTRRIGELIFDKIQRKINEDNAIIFSREHRYVDSEHYHQEPVTSTQTVLDLDSLNHRQSRPYSDYTPNDSSLLPYESSDDAHEDHLSDTPSYGSDGSKSGDEEDKKNKMYKRPPGRPKGSGKRIQKRPRSVSVPEFLRNLLRDPKYCPSIIKWEDYSQGKFRFVKPDEVAKLWGKMKQNENMTFEKFSRAMRYHYRQSVLVSVPTARLVYQFGSKGPDFRTDNPNFTKIKPESDYCDMSYS